MIVNKLKKNNMDAKSSENLPKNLVKEYATVNGKEERFIYSLREISIAR